MKNATFLSRNPICSILQTLCRPFMFYIMCFQCLILSKIICYQSLSRLLSGSNILGRPSWIMQIWQSSTNLIHTDFWYVILGPFLSRKMMVWFLLQFVQGWPPFCRRLTGLFMAIAISIAKVYINWNVGAIILNNALITVKIMWIETRNY